MTNILPGLVPILKERVQNFELEEMEERFDDLRSAQDLANAYLDNAKGEHADINSFLNDAKKVDRVFRRAVNALGKKDEQEQIEACRNAYIKAINGQDNDHKFVRQWKKIYSTKVRNIYIFSLCSILFFFEHVSVSQVKLFFN